MKERSKGAVRQHSVGQSAMPTVAVVGCGYWGKNLVRNFSELGALVAVADANGDVATEIGQRYGVPARSVDDIVGDSLIKGVALASPAALHAAQAIAALEAGKHVFVEKPLALTVTDARTLVQLAEARNRVLMVGHLLRYHPAVVTLTKMVSQGEMGRVRRITSNRLSFGKVRSEEDVLWSFAPHDISMVLELANAMPNQITAFGTAALNPAVLDIVDVVLEFTDGTTARVSASWLNPIKEHRLTVIGELGQAVFDDTLPLERKLAVFAHRAGYVEGAPFAEKSEPRYIALSAEEPLKAECQHFLHCLAGGGSPRTDGREALRVLSVLDAASRSLKSGRTEKPLVVD